VIRRRKTAIGVRSRWAARRWAAVLNSQSAMAAITPRAPRIISLVELAPGKRYVDVGCGTASYAHLLAVRAGMKETPITLDLAAGPGPVAALAWPEKLPLADASVDCLTSLYFIHRFDDDVVHAFAGEIARVLRPGGAALVMDIAPVKNGALDRFHRRLISPGCAEVDLRGWGRLAALFTESGFDAIDLVNVGPFLFPPIPRVGVLLRRAP
jgi:SAM-dependent methyltransferase